MYKILIIEDEFDTASVVKEALGLVGYEADIANNGEEGLLMFNKNTYDLVLLDIKMPKLDGTETLKKIREKDPYVYVIVYTNYNEFEDLKNLTNIGIDGFVNKGASAELRELLDMIQQKLEPLDEVKLKELVKDIVDLPKE